MKPIKAKRFVPKKVTPVGRSTSWPPGPTSTGGYLGNQTGTYTTNSGTTYHFQINVPAGSFRGNWSGSFRGRIGVR